MANSVLGHVLLQETLESARSSGGFLLQTKGY